MYTIPDASSLPDNGGILKGPADKGSDPYVQWISRLWRETAKINNQDARRYFETCRLYLEVSSNMLEIFVNKSVSSSIRTSRLIVLVREEARFMLSKCLFYYILVSSFECFFHVEYSVFLVYIRVPLVEQELPTLPEQLNVPRLSCRVCVGQSLVYSVLGIITVFLSSFQWK
jgi:hypothetical protein